MFSLPDEQRQVVGNDLEADLTNFSRNDDANCDFAADFHHVSDDHFRSGR